jgi:hypothetical protein
MLVLNIFSTTNGHSPLLNFDFFFFFESCCERVNFYFRQIGSHPNIYVLDTPGVLPPKIPDTKVCSNSIQDVHLILSIQ